MNFLRILCLPLAAASLCAAAAGQADPEPMVMGWAEPAIIYPAGIEFRAKLDTGARTSSINATRIREIRRGGRSWVTFTIDNSAGATADLELPVQRFVRIREHGGSYQRRPVVNLGLCVGTVYKEAEVNLVDRTGFVYPLLIGRTFLKGDILVDSAVTRTREPECPLPGGPEPAETPP